MALRLVRPTAASWVKIWGSQVLAVLGWFVKLSHGPDLLCRKPAALWNHRDTENLAATKIPLPFREAPKQ
ncbi:MAG: hypothetical protein CMJ72_15410 [Planctomycetaceae bacterium]|nr:hypothetical protein [Planctomycetaceae bacterium]